MTRWGLWVLRENNTFYVFYVIWDAPYSINTVSQSLTASSRMAFNLIRAYWIPVVFKSCHSSECFRVGGSHLDSRELSRGLDHRLMVCSRSSSTYKSQPWCKRHLHGNLWRALMSPALHHEKTLIWRIREAVSCDPAQLFPLHYFFSPSSSLALTHVMPWLVSSAEGTFISQYLVVKQILTILNYFVWRLH